MEIKNDETSLIAKTVVEAMKARYSTAEDLKFTAIAGRDYGYAEAFALDREEIGYAIVAKKDGQTSYWIHDAGREGKPDLKSLFGPLTYDSIDSALRVANVFGPDYISRASGHGPRLILGTRTFSDHKTSDFVRDKNGKIKNWTSHQRACKVIEDADMQEYTLLPGEIVRPRFKVMSVPTPLSFPGEDYTPEPIELTDAGDDELYDDPDLDPTPEEIAAEAIATDRRRIIGILTRATVALAMIAAVIWTGHQLTQSYPAPGHHAERPGIDFIPQPIEPQSIKPLPAFVIPHEGGHHE